MTPRLVTLQARGNALASAPEQLRSLDRLALAHEFHQLVPDLRPTRIDTLQINVGKVCNQTCRHCHVDAGPDRVELMSQETMAQCLAALAATDIPTVDITGGAPEMNPHFEWLVTESCGWHLATKAPSKPSSPGATCSSGAMSCAPSPSRPIWTRC